MSPADPSRESPLPQPSVRPPYPDATSLLRSLLVLSPEHGSKQLTLVIDTNASMTIWLPDLMDLRRSLLAAGFDKVPLLALSEQTSAELPAEPIIRNWQPDDASELALHAQDLAEGSVLLVLTDGAAFGWRTGSVQRMLAQWATQLPLAIVHLLPETRWHLTGLDPHALRFAARSAQIPYGPLIWRARDAGLLGHPEPEGHESAIAIPLLELQPPWLDRWLQLVIGSSGTDIDLTAVLVNPDHRPGSATPESQADQEVSDPAADVAEFRAGASPHAFTLATHLCATPLDLDLIEAIRHRLLPQSTTGHVSQLLASSLLTAQFPHTIAAGGLRVAFDFRPGVREVLLGAARRTDIARIARLVDARLPSAERAEVSLLPVLADPDAVPGRSITVDTLPWRQVERSILHALSGRYLARARRLDDALRNLPDQANLQVNSKFAERWPNPLPQPDNSERISIGRPGAHGGSGERSPGHGDQPHDEGFRRKGADMTEPTASTSAAEISGAQIPLPDLGLGPGRSGTLPRIWGNVPLRNPNFTGRGDLLKQLRNRLERGMLALLPHALHGMGGVGKSQLAVEYLYRYLDEYDLVWWIPAERTTRIASALIELSGRMGLSAGNEVSTAVPAVLEALRRGEPFDRWLLVFDNAESPDSVRNFFPSGGRGHILVTSRDAQWNQVAISLEVNVFKREESVQLLRIRGPELTDEDADRMAEALGDLPLGIEQAAAWRAETGMPASEYLRLLDEKRTDLLELSPPLDYQTPVIAAWNVSLDQLQLKNPAALQLLQVCSAFAAEPIARAILSRGRGTEVMPELDSALRDPIRFGRAVRDISRYSLARIDHRTTSIQMHRLVQAALLSRMTEDERRSVRHAAHVVLAASDPNDPENFIHWPLYGELLPHLIASDAFECDQPWVRELAFNEVCYLSVWGAYAEGERLARAALARWRVELGEDDLQTLKMALRLAFILFLIGRYPEAAELNAHVLARRRVILGEDHENTLFALSMVSGDRRVQGDFGSALELSRTVHERSVRVLGPDEPDTLNAAHNLGVSLRLAGHFIEARTVDQATWERKAEIFGTDHIMSLLTRLGLLIDIRELGDYMAAPGLHLEAVAQCESLLGHRNPITLSATRLLAVARRKAGQHQEALHLSERVLQDLASRYGDQHPEVLAAELELTVNLRQTGDLRQARDRGSAVEDRYGKNLGRDHPHTLSARVNLAITQRLLGEAEIAAGINSEVLTTFERTLRPNHPLTLITATNLATDLYVLGQVDTACELDTSTVERSTAELGSLHPSTLSCRRNLAIDLKALGRLEEAEALHQASAHGMQTVLSLDHPGAAQAVDWELRANCDIDPMPL